MYVRTALLMLMLHSSGAAGEIGVRYRYTRLREPTYLSYTIPHAIHESDLVGCTVTDDHGTTIPAAYVRLPGGEWIYPGGISVGGVNAAGVVCGGTYTPSDRIQPYLWSAETGRLVDLNWCVGEYYAYPSMEGAFLWRPESGYGLLGLFGSEVPLPSDVSNAGMVVGRIGRYPWDGQFACTWEETEGWRYLPLLPGGVAQTAPDINRHEQIAGRALVNGIHQAYVLGPVSGYRLLGSPFPGIAQTEAYALNDRGDVVGFATPVAPGSPTRAFIWLASGDAGLLDELVDPCEPQPVFRWSSAVDNLGRIAARDETIRQAVLLTPYLPGDLDRDSHVDTSDLATLLMYFGSAGASSYEQGDLDCDADVDLSDLTALLARFGDALP
jgi:hypothetical protein